MDEIKQTEEIKGTGEMIDESVYLKQKKLFHKSFLFFLVIFLIGGSFFLCYKKGQ